MASYKPGTPPLASAASARPYHQSISNPQISKNIAPYGRNPNTPPNSGIPTYGPPARGPNSQMSNSLASYGSSANRGPIHQSSPAGVPNKQQPSTIASYDASRGSNTQSSGVVSYRGSAQGLNTQDSMGAYGPSGSRSMTGYHPQQQTFHMSSPASMIPRPVPGLPECPEKDVDTFIGCPIVVLLQHKDYCAVKLQAIEEGTHAIKCRNCPYQTSEPMAMLEHLAKLHKRYTDTQYLCQLNSTYMGQKPVCFGVTGYDELPDGLSDFLDGIYRWDKRTQDMVIVFPCRLCPTCYLTKSDLKAHYHRHQQGLQTINKPRAGKQHMFVCRICRQEFQDFISYYDHHTWMRLPEEILPQKKPGLPEPAQKALTQVAYTGEASTGGDVATKDCREADAFPRQVAKQPRHLNAPEESASTHAGLMTNQIKAADSAAAVVGTTQANPINLSVGHQMSIVDRALTYPVYQEPGSKQLEQGIVNLCCPYCQAVYKYRHWLAMHLQNIHGVNDKRALSEALTTSYAKNAANYYVVKTEVPSTKHVEDAPLGKTTRSEESAKVEIISCETKPELPMPRPDHKMLEALGLMPKINSLIDQPAEASHVQSKSSSLKNVCNPVEENKNMPMPDDDDEGIGEMDTDTHVNSSESMEISQANLYFQQHPSYALYPRKRGKGKQSKSPRGRPKKGCRQQQPQQGKLAALCEELAKRVENQQEDSGGSKESGNQSSEGFVTCDICSKTFKHKNQLWGHKKTHSKIYTCREGKDARGTKAKSSRLGRRQNMPNFRDIANGKVPPVSEMSSVAIPAVKRKSRNTLGSTKGKHFKPPTVSESSPSENMKVSPQAKIRKIKKQQNKKAKRKAKAIAKLISAYKDGTVKKRINIKEGHNAFYPRRFYSRYCLVRRQDGTRRKLGNLRKLVLLEIDADTSKNIYQCRVCRHYHRFHRRCLQHYQDKHLSPKKQSQKLRRVTTTSPVKNRKRAVSVSKVSAASEIDNTTDAEEKASCRYCNSPFYTCSLHTPDIAMSKGYVVKTDERGRNFFSCSTCHKEFPYHSSLLRHLNSHLKSKSRDVPCPSCSFVARSPLSLAAHSRVHKKSPNKDGAGTLYHTHTGANKESTTILKPEIQEPQVATLEPIRKPTKAFNCNHCDQIYHNLAAFRQHKATHKDYYPYRCNQCPAYFKQPEDMYEHIHQMHTSKNPHKCTTCAYTTASTTSLLKHQRGHERDVNKAITAAATTPAAKTPAALTPATTTPVATTPKAMTPAATTPEAKTPAATTPAATTPAATTPAATTPAATTPAATTSAATTPTATTPTATTPTQKTAELMPPPAPAQKTAKLMPPPAPAPSIPASTSPTASIPASVALSPTESSSISALDLRVATPMEQPSSGIESDEKERDMVKQPKPLTEAEIIESLSGKFQKVEVNSESDDGWYFCTECNYTTSKQDSYSRHFKMHEREEMLTCDECDFPVYDQQGLEEHMLKAHNKNVQKMPCDLCQYVTSVPERMVRHQRLHKKMTLHCDECGYRTPEKRFMIRHILTVHEQQRPFSCEKCNYQTAYKHHLKRHYRLHKQQILRCPKCVHCTLDEKLMLHHIKTHKKDITNVKCDICSREFVNTKSLGIHKSRDHGVKHSISIEDAINMSTIPGSRQYRSDISVPMRHHNETPLQLQAVTADDGTPETYKCKACSYTTTHQGSITLHMVENHMNEEIQAQIKDLRDVQQCAQCGFCTTKDQLDAHLRSHEEKDVYHCDSCNFRTPHVNAWTRHICGEQCGDEREKNPNSGSSGMEKATPMAGTTQTDTPMDMTNSPTNDNQPMVISIGDDSELVMATTTSQSPMETSSDTTVASEPATIIANSEMPGFTVIKTEPNTTAEIDQLETPVPVAMETSPPAKDSGSLVPEGSSQQNADLEDGVKCQICDKIYDTEDLVKKHVKAEHTHLVVSAQHPFVCIQCPYSSCSEKEARRHLGLHNYDQQFKCEYCVFSTSTASSIATHRKVHRANKRQLSNKRNKNASCQRVPSSLIGNYASGILVDVGGVSQRRYPCKFCGDVFQVAEEWQHHERRHLMVWNLELAEGSKAKHVSQKDKSNGLEHPEATK